ncbi:hypothetical protein [Winogradskyella forsetii]|uniref:hypothetical protein n=1 Tax=Winogradskyella forsetii TaxID=2686077 RepID=UPI0015BC6E28|nr:hypothetical protein [Winogradskyella forsetii]
MLTRYVFQALKELNPDHPKLAYEHVIALFIQNLADQTLDSINKDKSNLFKKWISCKLYQ